MNKSKSNGQELSQGETKALLDTLEHRFEKNKRRHEGIRWSEVAARLQAAGNKLWSLQQMESSGGEPDVIGVNENTGGYIFCDCSAESPAGRRSLCYDAAAWEARKEARPQGSAVAMAAAMGIELLTEALYRRLQELGSFDMKTSSWIATPPAIRKLGGALFCDRRYDHVFVYHNGASSYYAARGFRGMLEV